MRTNIPLNPADCSEIVISEDWKSRIIEGADGCLLITTRINSFGYARVTLNGSVVYCHRVALVAHLGRDILPGLEAGHLCHDRAAEAGTCSATNATPCDHRRCVNPDHLAEQTHEENNKAGHSLSAQHARKTHCPRGHPLDGPGAMLVPSRTEVGVRNCLVCQREDAAAQHAVIRDAHIALGISQRTYKSTFGSSRRTAEEVLLDIAEGRDPWLRVP
jgi:hypothetical protein